jgi:uncharacterized protein YbjT (DUF2867 family)
MRTCVVSGATGRTGSIVARELRNRGHQVTAIVRESSPAGGLEAQGIHIARGSLEDRDAITNALKGADSFFVLLPEDPFALDFHDRRERMANAIAGAVRESSVPHVVLLSALAATLPAGNGPARTLHQLENALGDTPTALTILRACWLQENIGAAISPATSASIYPNFLPTADAAFPTIAIRDVGRFAADVQSHAPRAETIDLLGPAYSVRQMAQVLGKALGRVLRVVDIPPPAHVPTLLQAGVSREFAEAVAELYTCFASGKVRPVGDRQLAGSTSLEETVGGMLGGAK